MNDLTQKEILIRLMDKVEQIDIKQSEHIAYSKAKLISIEDQAKKTNGRVTENRNDINEIKVRQENLGTKVGTGVFIASTLFVYLINKIL